MFRSLITCNLFISALLVVTAFGAALAADAVPEKPPPPAEEAAKEEPAEKPKAPAEEAAEKTPAEEHRIVIDADEIESKGNNFTFIGNVIVVRGDVRLTCDRMDAIMEEVETVDPKTKKKTTRKQITSLVAVGHVIVVEESTKRRAIAHKADYDVRKELIVMTGTEDQRPRMSDGKMTTEGHIGVYDLKKRKFYWKGGRSTLIFSEGALAPDTPEEPEKKKPE